MKLLDNSIFGCEAALISVPVRESGMQPTLFFSEPTAPDRTKLVLRCSQDGGATWPRSFVVHGDNPAAYSAICSDGS